MSQINHKVNFRSYVLPCVMKANGNIAIDTKSKPADGIDLNHLLNKGFLYHYNSNTCHFYPLSLLLIIKYLSPQKLLKCQNIFSFLSSSSLTLQQRKSEYKILRLNFWYIFNILDRNFCYPASKSTTGKKKTFKEMESRRDQKINIFIIKFRNRARQEKHLRYWNQTVNQTTVKRKKKFQFALKSIGVPRRESE